MNVALLWLTKLYLRFSGARFTRTEVIRLLNEEHQEIIVFSGDKFPWRGQLTLFGTTIIHESAFSTQSLLNYIVYHETGHKKQWYGYFIYPVMVVCVPAFFLLLLESLWSLLASLIFLAPSYLLGTLLGLFFAALSLAVVGLYSWALELNADFYAINKLGLQAFLNARSAIPKQLKRPLFLRFIILLTHPPESVTIRIYHWTHRKPQQ